VIGNIAVAQFLAAVTRTLPADASAEVVELNGEPGLVLKVGGQPIVAILVETDGERIYSVYGISNPDKLGGIAAASGPLPV
jgi:RNA polymerase sigma-70 factor, ECF subfamily